MSATTGTIQRPLGQGSIFGTVALAAVALLAVLAITWGAMNLASTKSVAAPLAPSGRARQGLARGARPASRGSGARAASSTAVAAKS